MRGLIIGLGMLAIAGTAVSVPALSQDVYVSGGRDGFVVGVDRGHRDRVAVDRDYRDRDRVVERRVVRDRAFARGDCRTIIIKRDGYTKKIRRCD
jgi:hypothetical protein